MLLWCHTSRFMQFKPYTSLIFFSAVGPAASCFGCQSNLYRQKPVVLSHRSNTTYRKYHSGNQSKSSSVPEMKQPMSEEAVATLRQRKQALRKEVRNYIRETYPPNNTKKLITQSNLVFSRLFQLPQYESAKSIGFFLSMPSGEIQTRDAICRMVADGKTLYVPRVGLDFENCDMDLIKAETSCNGNGMFYDVWPRNKWNIPEPPVDTDGSNIAQPGDIDVLLVPGLAFDVNGHRLGQGKGYYDRFISKMRGDDAKAHSIREMKPLLVGICLEEQYLDKDGFEGIPVANHDYIMDMVITPRRTLDVKK